MTILGSSFKLGGSLIAAGALAIAGLTAGCSESTIPAGPAQHLTLLGGGGQRGQATDVLAEKLAVRVADDAGLPVPGLTVSWSSPDGGYFIPATDRTDAQGIARTQWFLGVRSGPQSAVVTVPGWDDRLDIGATALPGLKAVSLMSGDPSLHMCAIAADGAAWCWTSQSVGNEAAVRSPMGDMRFRALAGGDASSCGLTESDELWCWNTSDWWNGIDAVTPVRVGPSLLFRSVDIERPMVCAVTLDNDGYCWGRGALGDGLPARASAEPVLVAGGHAWREIAASTSGACGTTLSGETLCWTNGNALQLMGLEGPGPFLVPTPVPMVPKLRSLTGSDLEQCGLIDGGTSALCWGWFGYQAPTSSTMYSPAPSLSFQKLSAAYLRSAGLDLGGTVWAWRKEFVTDHGLFEEPTPMTPEGVWRDVSATVDKIYAILAADSTVHAWGVRYRWPEDAKEPVSSSIPPNWRYPSAIRVGMPPP